MCMNRTVANIDDSYQAVTAALQDQVISDSDSTPAAPADSSDSDAATATKSDWKLYNFCPNTSISSINDTDREARRLLNLKSYDILDSEKEAEFETITKEAADYFKVPIVAISLVDLGRQWFKSQVGLPVDETPRDQSFCDHVVRRKEEVDPVMVVEDATKDERFRKNPLVTGGLNIRFYAGAPIESPEGERLGAFCLIDNKNPRPQGLKEEEKKRLIDFAFEAAVNIVIRWVWITCAHTVRWWMSAIHFTT